MSSPKTIQAPQADSSFEFQNSSPSSPETVARARAILDHHAKTFRSASVFLSSKQRDDAAIAYAFCRLIDDAVDEAADTATAQRQLNELETAVETGHGDPIVVAYRELALRTGFGLEPAQDLIRGARSDLGAVRVADDAELLTYCYRVAGTVGLMMCGILGVHQPEARRHAIDLGIGMQLTNICRDVLEDAERDRVYLPANRLEKAGVNQSGLLEALRLSTDFKLENEFKANSATAQLAAMRPANAVAEVVSQLLSLADLKYESGARGFHFLPVRPRLAIGVASHLYRNIGLSLRHDRGCNALLGRVTLSSSRKRVLTFQAVGSWFAGLFGARPKHNSLPPHISSSV